MSAEIRIDDDRSLRLAPDAADRLSAGVAIVADVKIAESPAVWAETDALAERLRAEHGGRLPSEIPGLRDARDLYKSFGMEPSRHRPSSEALLRRVLKGKGLYRISNAVDVCNLASLSFLLPIGMYDLDRIEGDAVMRVGREGEGYPGIRKGPVNLGGRLGLFDGAGGFGSPTSDSDRTRVREDTSGILAVIMATAAYSPDTLAAHTNLLADLFVRHCGARVVRCGLLTA